jgi:hypothetical protein
MMVLLKNPLKGSRFFSFPWSLAEEEEFVAVINLPLHDFSRFDVDGGGQRQRQVDVALRDRLLAADGLDFGWVVHFVTLVN